MSSLTVSILIPTLGRSQELIDTVKGLTRQTVRPHEIIIVDQNHPEIPEVTGFLKTIPYVKHVRNVEKGLVVNYNRCLRLATGDVVLYVDDDVIAPEDLVERHLANYQEAARGNFPLGGVAGRVENAFGDTDPERIHKWGAYNRWTGQVHSHFNALSRREVQFAQGAHMSFKREALMSIGGFDEGFVGNGYFFETDGGLRLNKAGYKMIFDPTVQVRHLMASQGGARITDKTRHTFFFVRNGLRLYRRHSPVIGLGPFLFLNLGYLAAKSIRNGNLSIFIQGLLALKEGSLSSLEIVSSLLT